MRELLPWRSRIRRCRRRFRYAGETTTPPPGRQQPSSKPSKLACADATQVRREGNEASDQAGLARARRLV